MPVRQWIICSLLLLGTAGWTRAGFSAEYIYLLAGQSNMIGKGKVSELAPHLRRTPANVSFYYQGRQQTLARFNHFGPEVLLAHQLARALPQDHHILVKFAATGSRLIQWVPGSPLYQGLLRQLSYVQTADGKPATLAAIFWMQGESDARNLAQARAYGERLQHLIQRLRTDTGSPQAPAFIGRINPVSDAFRWRDEVRQQQQQVTQTLPMTYLVETQGLGKLWDQLHYNAQGQIGLGERFASGFLQQRKSGPIRMPVNTATTATTAISRVPAAHTISATIAATTPPIPAAHTAPATISTTPVIPSAPATHATTATASTTVLAIPTMPAAHTAPAAATATTTPPATASAATPPDTTPPVATLHTASSSMTGSRSALSAAKRKAQRQQEERRAAWLEWREQQRQYHSLRLQRYRQRKLDGLE